MKRLFKWVGILLLSYILIYGGYFYYNLYSGPTRMGKLCGQLQAGLTWTDVKRFGAENDFLVPTQQAENWMTRIAEGRTMGRFGCEISLEGGLVKGALPFHMD